MAWVGWGGWLADPCSRQEEVNKCEHCNAERTILKCTTKL
jgi:hypothetical protein